jgi:hypothetical protein
MDAVAVRIDLPPEPRARWQIAERLPCPSLFLECLSAIQIQGKTEPKVDS